MKRKVLLMILILSIFMGLKIDVYASSYSDKFYISDVIEGISYAKVKNGKTEYRQAKFKRRSSDNKIVYCIEPFVNMAENTNYKGYDANYEKVLSMSKSVWKRVSLLAYYGYNYKKDDINHTADKWYPITQIMIWKTIDKNATFYWTDTYEGKKVTKYTKEMEEIETLVKNHDKKPSFDGDNIDMSISTTLTLKDENEVLSDYKISNSNGLDAKIDGNNLIINSKDTIQNIDIELVKKDTTYKTTPIVYVSDSYQNVLSVGSYTSIDSSLNISIDSGSIKIVKQDADTNSITPSGEGKLIGTIFEVRNENGDVVGEITIGEDNTGILKDLKYGKYTIKEKESGQGYILDDKEYEVTIDSNNKTIELVLNNEIIKKKIRLHKYFQAENNKKLVEENITFQIIDSNDQVYCEVTTNEYGEIELELPYGKYIVKQKNTTAGYAKVDDFEIVVDENAPDVMEYYLNDLKLPDTYDYNYNNLFISSMLGCITLLCWKLKYAK